MEKEYNELIQQYGHSEIGIILGDLDSYKDIRIECSYINVLNEIDTVMNDNWTIYGSNIY